MITAGLQRILTHVSLFTGIAMIDLAAMWAGFTTIGQVEISDYSTAVLEKHFPDVPRWRDIRDVSMESYMLTAMPIYDMAAPRNEKYDEAVELYKQGFSVRDVAFYFGVTHQAMWKILGRRTTLRPQKQEGGDNVFYRDGSSTDKRAQHLVEKAIKIGLLVPQPCEECGASVYPYKDGRRGIIAHHKDYNKPLEVNWLCEQHHYDWHKHNRATPREGGDKKEVIRPTLVSGGFP